MSKKKPTAEVAECIICAERFSEDRIRAIGPCDHEGMCSICFLRIRSLGNDLSCPMCKNNLENVICYHNDGKGEVKQYSSFSVWGETCGPGEFTYDHGSSMFFPTRYYRRVIEPMWVRSCTQCPESKRDIKAMKAHLQSAHNLMMCALCIENKQCFPCEQRVYTQQSYDVHLRQGDRDGSDGHPNCEFCKKRFYDKYFLFTHLQKEHFTCHICEKKLGIKHQYFDNYDALQDHFKYKHYLCADPHCLEQKFVVFSDEISLMAHNRQHHPSTNQNRRVQYRNDYEDRRRGDARDSGHHHHHNDSRGGGGGRGGGGRGRFDAGIMGGRATRDGQWQIVLDESQLTRDPRAASRGEPPSSSSSSSSTSPPPQASSTSPTPEDFPGLPPSAGAGAGGGAGSGSSAASGFGFGGGGRGGAGGGMGRSSSAEDFPALAGGSGGPAPAPSAAVPNRVGRMVTHGTNSNSSSTNNSNPGGLDLGLWNNAVKKGAGKKLSVYKNPGGSSSANASPAPYNDALNPPPPLGVALRMKRDDDPPVNAYAAAYDAAATGASVSAAPSSSSSAAAAAPGAQMTREERKKFVASLVGQQNKSPAEAPPAPAPVPVPAPAPVAPKAHKPIVVTKPKPKSSQPAATNSILSSIVSGAGSSKAASAKSKSSGISVMKMPPKPAVTVDTPVASGPPGVSISPVLATTSSSSSSSSSSSGGGNIGDANVVRLNGNKDFPSLQSNAAAASSGGRSNNYAGRVGPADSSSSSGSASMWACSTCTLHNPLHVAVCSVCGSHRVIKLQQHKKASAATSSSSASSAEVEDWSMFSLPIPPAPPSIVDRSDSSAGMMSKLRIGSGKKGAGYAAHLARQEAAAAGGSSAPAPAAAPAPAPAPAAAAAAPSSGPAQWSSNDDAAFPALEGSAAATAGTGSTAGGGKWQKQPPKVGGSGPVSIGGSGGAVGKKKK